MDTNSEARALRTGFDFGLVGLQEIISWEDTKILLSEFPSRELIDLSMTRSLPQALMTLEILSIGAVLEDSWRRVVLLIRDGFEQGKISPEKASMLLYEMALREQYPGPSSQELMSWFMDAVCLANSGTWGNSEEVKSKLGTFLKDYAS